jgi:hypothetical protein
MTPATPTWRKLNQAFTRLFGVFDQLRLVTPETCESALEQLRESYKEVAAIVREHVRGAP